MYRTLCWMHAYPKIDGLIRELLVGIWDARTGSQVYKCQRELMLMKHADFGLFGRARLDSL